MKRYFSILILVLFVSSSLFAQAESELLKKLKTFPEIESITPIKADTMFSEAYEIMIKQPLDHNNAGSKHFLQRIFLSHKDFSKPMVFDNEGYSARNFTYELSRILNCNQIICEHRYFGKSVPDSLDWQYLNIEQAAADHHKIVTIFKRLYTGKWISTGISKGGQTTIFFRYFYPNDVDVSVPYVAPLNLEQEDGRVYKFFKSVGTPECREKILEFQRALLSHRNEILPLLAEHAKKENYTFSLGLDTTFEYSVFEFPFAFWQWGYTKCEDVPSPDSPADSLFRFLVRASSYDYFSDASMKYFAPFMVQAYKEIGYYGYLTAPFKDLLKAVKSDTAHNSIFLPKDFKPVYNKKIMPEVNSWLREHGNNFLYIYGGNDAWTSTSVVPGPNTNAVKMVKQGGSHRTRIGSFEGAEKEKIYSTLEKWLDVKITR